MEKRSRLERVLLLTSLCSVFIAPSLAQPVIKIQNTASPLAGRWQWGNDEARQRDFKNGYWIGYSILRLMEQRTFIGSYRSDPRENKPTLLEIISGVRLEHGLDEITASDNSTSEGVIDLKNGDNHRPKIVKEIGILFHFNGGDSGKVNELRVSNLSLHVELEKDALVWVGSANQTESASLLESLYKNACGVGPKERFMMAVSLHDSSARSLEFLKAVLQGTEEADVRKGAAFWLGQKATEKTKGTLKELVYEDEDTDVQRNALYTLAQKENGNDVDELIRVVRTHPNPKVRKEAIFLLGESENPKALEALIEFVKK